jgi:crossover junction endodeoxyribonuclease RuvC
MMLLGIDPGRHGALAVLDPHSLTVACHDMPETTAALHDLVAGLPLIRMAMVERPFYPPAIGIRNATTIAYRYGILLGALACRDIPHTEVRPEQWKRALNVPADKRAAVEKAGALMPASADQWKRAKDHGRAEAALLVGATGQAGRPPGGQPTGGRRAALFQPFVNRLPITAPDIIRQWVQAQA